MDSGQTKGSIAPTGKVTAGARSSRLKILIVLLLAVLLLAGGVAAYKIKTKRGMKAKETVPTVTFEGKQYKALFLQHQQSTKLPGGPASSDKQIADLEKKLETQPPTANDYRTLAQLYMAAGNNEKALEYYKRSNEIAKPDMPDYASFIDVGNKMITLLEGRINDAKQ